MSNKNLINREEDGYSLIELESTKDFIQVYFRREDERIILVETKNMEGFSYDNYLEFTIALTNQYIKDDFHLEKYTDIVPFDPTYLRYNFVFNKTQLLNLMKTKQELLRKLDSFVGIDNRNGEEFIKHLNEKLNNHSGSRAAHLFQIEIPLLVFICQYVMEKHKGELVIRKAENDLNDSFYVPDVVVNNSELNLNKRLFKYLYHPEVKPIDITAFLYLIDFLVNGNISVEKKR